MVVEVVVQRDESRSVGNNAKVHVSKGGHEVVAREKSKRGSKEEEDAKKPSPPKRKQSGQLVGERGEGVEESDGGCC